MTTQEFSDLQQEIADWHRTNYPNDDAVDALLGVHEEFGELCRAELKQRGGIRGTFEYWQEEKVKESGDVFIGLLNYATHMGFPVTSLVLNISRTFKDSRELLLSLDKRLANLRPDIDHQYTDCINYALIELVWYIYSIGMDPATVLLNRWNTISKRDFIANPQTGGRENE